jgi:hypothetical protein
MAHGVRSEAMKFGSFALDLNVMFAASDHRVTETMPGRQGGAWRLDRIVGAGG